MKYFFSIILVFVANSLYSQDLQKFSGVVKDSLFTENQLVKNALLIERELFDSICQTSVNLNIVQFKNCKTGFVFKEGKMKQYASFICDLIIEVKENRYRYSINIVSFIATTYFDGHIDRDVIQVYDLEKQLKLYASSFGIKTKDEIPDFLKAYEKWKEDMEGSIKRGMAVTSDF